MFNNNDNVSTSISSIKSTNTINNNNNNTNHTNHTNSNINLTTPTNNNSTFHSTLPFTTTKRNLQTIFEDLCDPFSATNNIDNNNSIIYTQNRNNSQLDSVNNNNIQFQSEFDESPIHGINKPELLSDIWSNNSRSDLNLI